MVRKTVELDAKALMDQATYTSQHYLYRAVRDIDVEFGVGYAKANPMLVSAYMQTCARDFQAMTLLKALENLAEAVALLERE